MTIKYWYYNERYSQTGGVYNNLEEALIHAEEDGMRFNKEEVEKEIKENGYYQDYFYFKITKLPYNGRPNIGRTGYFILRYPRELHDSWEDAAKSGLKYIFKDRSWFSLSYIHKISKYYDGNYIPCDALMLSRLFERNFGNKTVGEIIDSLTYEETTELWEFRIECEGFYSDINHIEDV